jgi:hypothetical protein
LDESRIETLARQHGIRQKRDEGGIAKTLLAFLRRADEGTLSRLIVEATILLAASRQNGTSVLKDAATLYKVNTEVIGHKVKQEFAAKAKAKKDPSQKPNPLPKPKERPSVPFFEGRRTCRLSFLWLQKLGRKTPLRFLPAPTSRFCSGLRSPSARQDDVPSLLQNSTA